MAVEPCYKDITFLFWMTPNLLSKNLKTDKDKLQEDCIHSNKATHPSSYRDLKRQTFLKH